MRTILQKKGNSEELVSVPPMVNIHLALPSNRIDRRFWGSASFLYRNGEIIGVLGHYANERCRNMNKNTASVSLRPLIRFVVCLWSAMVLCPWHTHLLKSKQESETDSFLLYMWSQRQTESAWSPERPTDRQKSSEQSRYWHICTHWPLPCCDWQPKWIPPSTDVRLRVADKGTEPIEGLTVWWRKRRRGKWGEMTSCGQLSCDETVTETVKWKGSDEVEG